MADGSLAGVVSLKGKVSEEEWKVRVDLAALYRLAALYGPLRAATSFLRLP